MLIREVADSKLLQAPAAKWQSHPKVGWCFAPCICSHPPQCGQREASCPPARILKLKVRSSASLTPSLHSVPTVSLLPTTPDLHPTQADGISEQQEEADAQAFESMEEMIDNIDLLDE